MTEIKTVQHVDTDNAIEQIEAEWTMEKSYLVMIGDLVFVVEGDMPTNADLRAALIVAEVEDEDGVDAWMGSDYVGDALMVDPRDIWETTIH